MFGTNFELTWDQLGTSLQFTRHLLTMAGRLVQTCMKLATKNLPQEDGGMAALGTEFSPLYLCQHHRKSDSLVTCQKVGRLITAVAQKIAI